MVNPKLGEQLPGENCFSDYSLDLQRTYVSQLNRSSFGPGVDVDGFTFQPGIDLNSFSTTTSMAFYDHASFAVEFPADQAKISVGLNGLHKNRWIDRNTRALMVSFNVREEINQ